MSSDNVTILKCGPGHSASKLIVSRPPAPPEVRGFNAGTYFGVLTKQVSDIRSLSELLLALEGLPDLLVIRGAPRPSLDINLAVRRKKENFATPAKGRRWLLVDFDKIALPPNLRLRDDPTAVAEHLVSLLPREFHDVAYHYQLSSSAGLGAPSVASMHVWFWLSEPWSDRDLRDWGVAVNERAGYRLVDTALFNDVQPHYVAAPVFEGMADPFPARSRLVPKRLEEVRLEPIASPPSESDAAEYRPGQPSPGFDARLELIGDHPGGHGFHVPIIGAIASYVGTHGREATDPEWLFETVRDKVLAADRSGHEEAYVEKMASREHIIPAIEGALTKFGAGDPRRRSRVVSGIQPHFPSASSSDAHSARAQLEAALRSIVKVGP